MLKGWDELLKHEKEDVQIIATTIFNSTPNVDVIVTNNLTQGSQKAHLSSAFKRYEHSSKLDIIDVIESVKEYNLPSKNLVSNVGTNMLEYLRKQ
jgi:hypothetical protein